MKPNSMLDALREVTAQLKSFMMDGPDAWESLDIDYEPPRVERLWRQVGEYRVNLHRIHPCAQALYHPHPWPSAVRILSGKYEMGVATCDELRFQNLVEADYEAAKVVLTEGAAYEMIHPYGWHYVKPLGQPSLSIMVTAKPWDPPVFNHASFGKTHDLEPMSDEAKKHLLDDVIWWYERAYPQGDGIVG